MHVTIVPKFTLNLQDISSTNPFLSEIKGILEKQKKFGINKETLTQEQLDIFAEEPLSTENPQLAVLGYDPKDDIKNCRFADNNGSCFKGANCKLRHLPSIEEGWTRDQVEVTIGIPLELEIPQVDSVIWLEPIVILSVNKFYAYLRNPKLTKLKALSALNKLMNFMNQSEVITLYKRYKVFKIRCIKLYIFNFYYLFRIFQKSMKWLFVYTMEFIIVLRY